MAEPQRLWQLISPALPVGAYSYSQGLEYAVEAGWVDDEKSCLDWVGGLAGRVMPCVDLPLLQRMHDAWRRGDVADALAWNRRLLAMRESGELLQEDRAMGQALARLAHDLDCALPAGFDAPVSANGAGTAGLTGLSYAAAFGWLCVCWEIEAEQAMAGYLWSWCENQVAAAVKLIPLGQTAGQRMLRELGDAVPAIIAAARACDDRDIGMTAAGLGIAGALHETQYTRLFRS